MVVIWIGVQSGKMEIDGIWKQSIEIKKINQEKNPVKTIMQFENNQWKSNPSFECFGFGC